MNILISSISSKYTILTFSLVIIFSFYLRTMLPSQAFHDMGELQTAVATFNTGHATGFPTYIILSKFLITLFPFGEIAWRVNLLSLVYSILALLFMSIFLFKLTKNYLWPILGVFYLAFTQPFWNWAGMANVHSLNRLFIFLLIFLFFNLTQNWSKKGLLIFSLTLGLGIGNHLLLIYTIPGFLVWYKFLLFIKKIHFSISDFSLGLLALCLGVSVYLFLPIREYFGPGLSYDYSLRTGDGFYRHAFGASFHSYMYREGALGAFKNAFEGLNKIYEYLGLIGTLFGLVGIIGGLTYHKFRVEVISLLIMFISLLITATNYVTTFYDQYYLSYTCIFAIFLGIGIFSIGQFLENLINRLKLTKLKTLFIYTLFFLILIPPLMLIKKNFESVDKSKNNYASYYAKTIFETVEQNAVIISWWNNSPPLWYRQHVLKERTDVTVLTIDEAKWKASIDKYIDTRPIFLTDRNNGVEKYYNISPFGLVFRVSQKR